MNQIAIIQQALSDTRIMSHDDRTVKKALSVMVQKAFVLSGFKNTTDDVLAIVREIGKDLQTSFKALTLAEVDIAISKGVKGCYGEYMGISAVTVYKWIKAYYHSDDRKAAQRQKYEACKQLPPITTGEQNNIMQAAYERCLEHYRQTGEIKDFGNAVYDWLDARGDITLTGEEKRAIFEQAKRQTISELKNAAAKTDSDFRPPIIRLLNGLENGSEDDRIKSAAKRLALEKHFKTLKS